MPRFVIFHRAFGVTSGARPKMMFKAFAQNLLADAGLHLFPTNGNRSLSVSG